MILDRYITIARAMASLGLNGITINNVNADNRYLTTAAIEQEAALADALRPYGIKLSLSINYGAPTDSRFAPDVLTAAQMDPTSADFRGWWSRKATAIHAAIPDFTGFTVKASSEGQPGPEMFGYDQGDGANGLAAALAPLGMKVFWRTFVYDAGIDEDRLKRAYKTFGYINDAQRFASNVLLQTKNGPLDYQAREPFNPMFGRMDNTSQALELEVTQEYTGQNIMLAYLGPMWEEALKSDTYVTDRSGNLLPKRLVGNIVDGSAQGQSDTAMVGVANLGNADDLVGNHFSAANLYAFGRLAWDWTQSSKDIADEWTRMTWGNDATRRQDDRADDDGLARGDRQLPDAARHRAPDGHERPLRARARRSGSTRTTRARSTSTRPTAWASATTARAPAATSSTSTSRPSRTRSTTSPPRPTTC